ncbi:MAG: malonyl-[acyl-carrier protein] O-methyltransferase BioC, partial [Gammaproteobacteria bacterium]|nr:malonyl-[acyl-carrier protein] O-methyltransferase BioC [Gammaproteobacteria bacterium]
ELTGELKRLGATNAAVGSARGLTTRSRLAAMSAAYDRLRADGALPASYEVVFAHAWRAPSRSVEVSSEALARGPASPRQ